MARVKAYTLSTVTDVDRLKNSDDGFVNVEMIYGGIIRGGDGETKATWHNKNGPYHVADALTFTEPDKFRNFAVGSAYTIPVKEVGDKTTFRFGYAEPHDPATTPSGVRESLIVRDRAHKVSLRSERMAATQAKEDEALGDTLRYLRSRYRDLRNGTDRLAFELLILNALRN